LSEMRAKNGKVMTKLIKIDLSIQHVNLMNTLKNLKSLPLLSQVATILCFIFIVKSAADLIMGISTLELEKSPLVAQLLILWLSLLWVLIPIAWLFTISNGKNTHGLLKWVALITVTLGLVRTLLNGYALWGGDITIVLIGLATQFIIFSAVWQRGLRG